MFPLLLALYGWQSSHLVPTLRRHWYIAVRIIGQRRHWIAFRMALQHFLSPDQWIYGKDGGKNAFDIICLLPNVQRRQSTLSEHGFGIRR